MTKHEIEWRRAWLRGITEPDDWVNDLCDLALKAQAGRLALLGIERMLESVQEDLKNEEPGNHATIGALMGEGKGLTAAKMLLEGALRGHHGDHASTATSHAEEK